MHRVSGSSEGGDPYACNGENLGGLGGEGDSGEGHIYRVLASKFDLLYRSTRSRGR